MNSQELEIPRNLSDQIYDIILERIILGELKGGDRIEISQLAKNYKISRSPIKDALNKLHGSGIVEISPRIGHYVRKLSREDIIDIFELRLMLELIAARRAYTNLTEEDVAFLDANVEQSIKLANQKSFSLMKLYTLDKEFHRRIVSLSQNAIIDNVHRTIHVLSHVARTQFPEARERTIESQCEHKSILAAFKEKDKKKIEEAMTLHLKNGENYLAKAFPS